jgi:hypothetical protein
LTDEEYTVFGRKQPPAKIYRTCTFEGLGSRKDEFLSRVVEAMEKRGLKKTSPIKPFKLAIEAKHIFSLGIWNEIGQREMVGTDVFLALDGQGTHTRMGLRAEPQGSNLRFGYFYGKWHDPKSPAAIKFFAKLIGGIILLCLWCFFVGFVLLGEPFAQAHEITVFLSVFVTLALLPFLPSVYVVYRKETQPRKDIDKYILEIAESMGGKQITPFRKTTVELED